jgi:hypothetical protein
VAGFTCLQYVRSKSLCDRDASYSYGGSAKVVFYWREGTETKRREEEMREREREREISK